MGMALTEPIVNSTERRICCFDLKNAAIGAAHGQILVIFPFAILFGTYFSTPAKSRSTEANVIVIAGFVTLLCTFVIFGQLVQHGVKKVKPNFLLPMFIFDIVLLTCGFLLVISSVFWLAFYDVYLFKMPIMILKGEWVFWGIIGWTCIWIGITIYFASIIMKCYGYLICVQMKSDESKTNNDQLSTEEEIVNETNIKGVHYF